MNKEKTKSKEACDKSTDSPVEIEYTLGAKLQKGRMRKKWDVKQVADKLCLSTRYIEAVESGNVEILPELSYTLGLIRAYCEIIDIHADPLIKEYHAIAGQNQQTNNYDIPTTIEKENNNLIIIGASVVVVSAVLWLFSAMYMSTPNVDLSSGVEQTSQDDSIDLQEQDQLKTNFQKSNDAPLDDSPNLLIPNSNKAQTTAPSTIGSGLNDKQIRGVDSFVLIKATAKTYVRIASNTSGIFYDEFLEKGEILSVPINGGYRLSVSNAASLTFSIPNAFDNIVIGKSGQSIVNIPLNRKSMEKYN